MSILNRTVCAAALVALPGLAQAAHISTYVSQITALNGSGVSGSAEMTLDTNEMTLAFAMALTGLEPGQLHVQHIHGAFDDTGDPAQSLSPTLADDADGDGFIELFEGFPKYGPIVLELRDPDTDLNGGFPVTRPDGTSVFTWVFDLMDERVYGSNILTPDPDDRFTARDLMPLNFREIVIHGLTLGAGDGANGGEADGTPGYKTVLPVAVGRIEQVVQPPAPVPLPAAGWALLAALGGLGALRARRG